MVLQKGTREPHLLSKPPAQGVPQAGRAVPASRPLAGALLPCQLTCGLLPCLSGPGSLSTYCLQQSRERVRLLPEWGAGAGKPAAALDRKLCRKENIWKQPSDLHATGRECTSLQKRLGDRAAWVSAPLPTACGQAQGLPEGERAVTPLTLKLFCAFPHCHYHICEHLDARETGHWIRSLVATFLGKFFPFKRSKSIKEYERQQTTLDTWPVEAKRNEGFFIGERLWGDISTLGNRAQLISGRKALVLRRLEC